MLEQLPEEILAAWNDREGPVVLSTVDACGTPNSIYAGIAHLTTDGRLAVCDNYFNKTKKNIDAGTKACLLFLAKNRKSYQVKGTIDYHISGQLYDEMLSWSDPKHPRKGMAVLNVETIYRGKDKLA